MLFLLSELSLSENTSRRVQMAKVGTFNHQLYGKFSISLSDIHNMKKHFDENARRMELENGPAIPIDYAHEDGKKSAGWGLKLSIGKDKKGVDGLFGEVEWTPAGAKAIRDKEFKFISPDIRRGYEDAETGEKFDVVLVGAGLTNIPFLRDMEAIHLLSEDKQKAFESLKQSGDDPDNLNLNEGASMKTIAEIMTAIGQVKMSPEDKLKLSEELAKVLEIKTPAEVQKLSEDLVEANKNLEKSKADLKLAEEAGKDDSEVVAALKLSEGNVKKLSETVEGLIKTMAQKDMKSEFDLMLSEGKVCEAQRDPFMKKDFKEFTEKAEAIKLSESGSNNNSEVSDATAKILKLAETKVKEAKEAGEELGEGDAISIVLSENKDLADKYYDE